jgi:transcriptional regulator with XRE-family HTH domain
MLAQWIGEVVGKMHRHKISKTQLAEHLGVTREYVSMVLNGHREPAGAQEKFEAAVNQIIASMATE